MGVPNVQCQILANTMRKADLEYRLLCITNTLNRMAAQTASLQEEVMYEVQKMYNFNSVYTDESSTDLADEIEAFASGEFYTAYQTQLALIHAKEKILDTEKTQVENEINAINTMNEGLEKELENDLKKSVLQV